MSKCRNHLNYDEATVGLTMPCDFKVLSFKKKILVLRD